MMRLICYDNTENGIKEFFWRRYVQARIGWKKIGVSSWHDALDKITDAVPPGTRLMELQLWGDGAPGMPTINGKSAPDIFWKELANLVMADSLVWFRMCSVFFGHKGQAFAERTANELNCRIAGHTRVIGPLQSGLWTLRPGQTPRWADGMATDHGDWQDYKSSWHAPRTIFCTTMKVPEGW